MNPVTTFIWLFLSQQRILSLKKKKTTTLLLTLEKAKYYNMSINNYIIQGILSQLAQFSDDMVK